ncbi:hypothetical protein JOF29_004486 [Kribbella aluminosa]|uniref:Uncharacterized protein n=1 Tax=Kribbella aluminosa TaxID=416017 RepID=A0ABS4UP19_9ACTN|nr:hypothetical protein [Kribbella aluminosa]MBP2353376.1 hypothetical protein [Kribbella aluminosa]
MRALLRAAALVAATAATVVGATVEPATAAPASLFAKVVVIGVPGLTWDDVKASPELTALVDQAHVGSISVKTAGPHTCPIDGWSTISAGTRAWGNVPDQPCGDLPAVTDGKVAGWQTYVDRQAEHHTGAPIGRLGQTGYPICGFGPGAAIALAKTDGSVANWQPTFDPSRLAKTDCGDAIVDAGALPLREGRPEARQKVADLVAQARAAGGWVLLVGVSQEDVNARKQTLVAMQLPPDNGTRWLTSDSTRRPGLIQLTDLTATILKGRTPATVTPAGSDETAPLDGSAIHFTGKLHTDAATVIEDRLDANQRYEQPRPTLFFVALTIVGAEVLALIWFLASRSPASRHAAIFTLLVQGGFYIAVFLAQAAVWWRWPAPGFSLYAVTIGISVLSAVLAQALLKQYAYFGLAVATYLLLLVDGVLGTPMQLGSMYADGPVIGGRFYGFGNSTFAALGVGALVTAGWAAHRLLDKNKVQAAAAVLVVGGAAIIVDGKPGWGTDFGGILALMPAVLLMAWLTWRGTLSLRALIAVGLASVLAVMAVAYLDYLRPLDQRTHFGTFFARMLEGDVDDVFIRKLQMAVMFFSGPAGWAMLIAVLLCVFATVFPDRVPSQAYRDFYRSSPMVRPTLLALSVCGIVGMLLNDAGVALPAIMGGFAVPILVAHLLASHQPATVSRESHLVQES